MRLITAGDVSKINEMGTWMRRRYPHYPHKEGHRQHPERRGEEGEDRHLAAARPHRTGKDLERLPVEGMAAPDKKHPFHINKIKNETTHSFKFMTNLSQIGTNLGLFFEFNLT